MTNQVIPAEAVEAAARASFERANPRYVWADIEPHWKAAYVENHRAALEAAAPHMLAGAWNEGATSGWKQSGEGFNAEYPDESTGECSVDLNPNPYRPLHE